ncbi:hypothetical protein SAMN04488515_0100 [Cognatiyoonia koreensis]|uniref:TonB C terminal n=1 Tax=Cognatiyoonia koreensis TaxID=364200 RepID=A0A1I0MLS1_9RHOB|nr:hypothetical protein [Cognatiyoonia koreensis]SEV89304.1 hypothetical protein SAMN04488515_0100 [Cognatiyoonia koreensis]
MMRGLLAVLLIWPCLAFGQEWLGTFRQAIGACWNTAGITESVTVRFQLDADGRVSTDIMLVGINNPTDAQSDAFLAARRAILRCQGENGFDLPLDDYALWQEVELNFTLPAGDS